MARKSKRKLNTKQYVAAIFQVGKLTYKAAPLAVIMQLSGAVITAVLPIVITYFAALTTTALASAYAGDPDAGSQAIRYVVITAILGILMMAWNSAEQYITKLMRYKVDVVMSDRMYNQFLALDFWRYDDKNTADLYDRATRFASMFPYVFDRLSGIVTQLFTMIAGIIALFLVGWWLGLIIVIAVIPSIYIQFKLSRAQIKHWDENIETRRSVSIIEWQLLQVNHVAELRLYGAIKHLLKLRIKLRDKDEKKRIDFERQYISKQLIADIIEAAAEVIALLWVVFQIIAKAQPIGQFLYVQQVVSRALGGARGFVSQVSQIDEDLANLFDYQEFMSLPVYSGGTEKITSSPEKIELKNVTFKYPHAKTDTLKAISLTIKKNQHVAIVGENGAGKSTLIKILTGLYNPSDGKVLIDDKDLSNMDIKSWHNKLGVLQQSFLHYGFATAKENILYGDINIPLNNRRLNQAIDRASAREFLEKLPNGINSYVDTWMEDSEGNNGTDLSGGQWQRLALARSFYRDSPIVILDEPTSAIDPLAESRIFKSLLSEKNRTIITVSHRLTTVEKADIIYVLSDGKLVEQGTHKELFKLKKTYYTMFEAQFRYNDGINNEKSKTTH